MTNTAIKQARDMEIREIERGDLKSLLELNNHLHESEAVLEATPAVNALWEQMLKDERLHCFVVEKCGELLATCTLDIVPNLTRGARPFAVLQNVVTHKDYRGQGIGGVLNQYALSFAWERNCYQVLVQTGRPEVVSFYERLGFRQDKQGLVARPEWCKE